MHEEPPPISLNRPLAEDEWTAALAWVLLHPRFNPSQDWLSLGEFQHKLLGIDARGIGAFNAVNGGGEAVDRKLRELCSLWAGLGLLVSVGEGRYALTKHGRDVLTEGWHETIVVLSLGELARALQRLSPAPGEAVVFYADQAQRCFVAGLYHPAAVMLGVAAEALLEPLYETTAALRGAFSLKRPSGRNARERLEWIRASFETRRVPIRQQLQMHEISAKWIDDLPGLLLGEANVIRLLRNDAGHPSPVRIDRRTAMGMLVVFPVLADAVTATASSLVSLRDLLGSDPQTS